MARKKKESHAVYMAWLLIGEILRLVDSWVRLVDSLGISIDHRLLDGFSIPATSQ